MGGSSSEIAGKTRDSILLVRKKRSRNVSSVISRVDRMHAFLRNGDVEAGGGYGAGGITELT